MDLPISDVLITNVYTENVTISELSGITLQPGEEVSLLPHYLNVAAALQDCNSATTSLNQGLRREPIKLALRIKPL